MDVDETAVVAPSQWLSADVVGDVDGEGDENDGGGDEKNSWS